MSNETTPRNTREDEATLELKLNTKIPHHEAGNPIAERVESANTTEEISKNGFWNYSIAKEIIAEEPEPYLIHGMFRKGSIISIAATQNAGKTLLLMDILASIASGANFLPDTKGNGGFKTEQGTCLFIDFEGDRLDTASRLIASIDTYSNVTGKDGEDIPVMVKYMPMDWRGSDSDFPIKIYQAITSLPEPYNAPSVIAFDTYTAFSDVENENDRAQATKIFERLKQLRNLFKIYNNIDTTIFITQHLRKLNTKSFEKLDMDDISGAGSQAAAASDIWLLAESDEPNTKKFRQVKGKARARDEEIKVIKFHYVNNNDGSLSEARFFMLTGTDAKKAQEVMTERRQQNNTKRKNEIMAYIAAHPNCSINQMTKADNPDRLQISKKTATPIVDELIKNGKLINLTPDGKGYTLCILKE